MRPSAYLEDDDEMVWLAIASYELNTRLYYR
jgi:hypothetical protein